MPLSLTSRTSVPTTALGTLARHGVYPDTYVGTKNLRIPDANEEHNARYHLGQYSHLPKQANPWAQARKVPLALSAKV